MGNLVLTPAVTTLPSALPTTPPSLQSSRPNGWNAQNGSNGMTRSNGNTHPQPLEVYYPDSDGQPMADNTRQYEWIVSTKEGFDFFLRNEEAFVAGDLLWYPVEGHNTIRQAPDVLIALGRPKGHRGSYKTWAEGGIAPQIVFEILSPGNRRGEMHRKRDFYEKYGVQEYYEYDPDHGELIGLLRHNDRLITITEMQGWVSPLTKVTFALEDGNMVITRPDGQRFETYAQLNERAEFNAQRAEAESQRAEAESQRAEAESQRAEAEATARRALEVEVAMLRAQLAQQLAGN